MTTSNPFEEIQTRLNTIENLLLDLKHQSKNDGAHSEIETPIILNEAVKIFGKSKPTIYAMVQRQEIPHHKKGNRLYFFKSEITDWIKTGKQKTLKEVEADADVYLSNRKK